MSNIVEFHNVSFSYQEEKKVLKNISFSIKENSYNTLIGPNGSGKSTIAKLLCALEAPSDGHIIVEGEIISKENIDTIRKKIGIIFQNPDNQFIANNVKEDIIFGLENHNVLPSKMDEIVDKVATLAKIKDFLKREPASLSGGEKQRVAIAAVIALKPKILILDEASSMLDPLAKNEFRELILELKEKQKLTIISITHDINETLIADNCILVNEGEIVFNGKNTDLYKLDLEKYNLEYPSLIKLQKKIKMKKHILNEDKFIKKIKEANLWR